jgi:putative PIN family toxin of toxin-antitoxin system
MDTNVLYAALRSRDGWSYEVLAALGQNRWVALVSNHLLHEYEEVLKGNAAQLALSLPDIDVILDIVSACSEECSLSTGWLPILLDPDDEPLAQLAVEFGADCVVTHNMRHLAPVRGLGIAVLPPRSFGAML